MLILGSKKKELVNLYKFQLAVRLLFETRRNQNMPLITLVYLSKFSCEHFFGQNLMKNTNSVEFDSMTQHEVISIKLEKDQMQMDGFEPGASLIQTQRATN